MDQGIRPLAGLSLRKRPPDPLSHRGHTTASVDTPQHFRQYLNCCGATVYATVLFVAAETVGSYREKESTVGRQTRFATAAAAALVAVGSWGAAPAAAAPGAPANHEPPPVHGPLASPQIIASITGAPGITVQTTQTELADTAARVQPRSCASVHLNAQKSSYAALGPVSAVNQFLADGEPAERSVVVAQAAVTMPSDSQALTYLNGLLTQWKECSGTTMRITESSGRQYEDHVGPVALHDNNTILTATTTTSGGTRCERAVAGKDNLVLDVNVCRFDNRDVVGQARSVVQVLAASSNNAI